LAVREEFALPDVRLDHCVIHVSDWGRSNAFYGDVLGAEPVRAGAGWSYRFGPQQLNAHGANIVVRFSPYTRNPENNPSRHLGE
jgi:catechol 2,3-dioxygenase-like lactoylglutathione lyase family enzyme